MIRNTALLMANFMINEKPMNKSFNSRTLIMKCFVFSHKNCLKVLRSRKNNSPGLPYNYFAHKSVELSSILLKPTQCNERYIVKLFEI